MKKDQTSSRISKTISEYWKFVATIALPLLLLPLPLSIPTRAIKCAYVVILMAVYWVTELLPLAVTAFLPVVLYPLLGVLDIQRVCSTYLKETNFLFVGSLIVAAAVEESGLHRRISLRVLMVVGTEPHWLLFGFMATTGFLSMWMSNTATTAMMLPIALAVIDELLKEANRNRKRLSIMRPCELGPLTVSTVQDKTNEQYALSHVEFGLNPESPNPNSVMENSSVEIQSSPSSSSSNAFLSSSASETTLLSSCHSCPSNATLLMANPDSENQPIKLFPEHLLTNKTPPTSSSVCAKSDEPLDWNSVPNVLRNQCKMLLISLSYAANVGGTATLTGTGPNVVLNGILQTKYAGIDTGITFASWIEFSFPTMVLTLFIAWCCLQLLYTHRINFFSLKKNKKSFEQQSNAGISQMLRQRYEELGSMTFVEGSVLFWFTLLVLLWVTRKPEVVPGWSSLFENETWFSDATPAMLTACILFVWPRKLPYFCRGKESNIADNEKGGPIMKWSVMQKKFSWGSVMLLGGGFAMAEGVEKSGLSKLIAESVRSLDNWPVAALVTLCVLVVVFITEFTSNVATASVFVPLGIAVAESICVNPLYFIIPITLGCSFAFMLPVATPPNAIVFSSGKLRVIDMVIAGTIMNIICVGISMLSLNTYANWLFALDKFPDWAQGDSMNFSCLNSVSKITVF